MSKDKSSKHSRAGFTRKAWVRRIAQVIIIIGIFVMLRAWMARDLAQGPALDFDGALLDGSSITLSEFAEEPMLLHFWATWCRVCHLEEGEIMRLSRSHPVLTVAMRSGGPADVEAHLSERERELMVVNDPNGRISDMYGVKAVPSTFILNTDKKIVFRKQGYSPPLELRIRLWLAKWL